MTGRLGDAEKAALIIKSTKTRRPVLDPFEVGAAINAAYKKGKSIKAIASEYSLSEEMVRELRLLATLPNKVIKILKSSGRKNLKDIAYRLTMLNTDAEKVELAELILKEGLDAKTVREIVRFKRYNEKVSIRIAYRNLIKAKDKITERVIIALPEELGTLDISARRKLLREVTKNLSRVLGDETTRYKPTIIIDAPFLIIDLSQKELTIIKKAARTEGLRIPELILPTF